MNKVHINATIDTDTYHNLKHYLPAGKISETINELLSQFLQSKKCAIVDMELINQQIDERTIELERVSSELTILKMRKADLLKEQAKQEREEWERTIAMKDTLLNAGILRGL